MSLKFSASATFYHGIPKGQHLRDFKPDLHLRQDYREKPNFEDTLTRPPSAVKAYLVFQLKQFG